MTAAWSLHPLPFRLPLATGLSKQDHSSELAAAELLSPQSLSQRGLIHLDDDSVSRFLTSFLTPRLYSIICPPPFSRTQVIVVLAIIAIWAPFALKKVLQGDTSLHNKPVWLIGAEGFLVGFLYTLVGLLLAGITLGLIKVLNLMVQWLFMGVAMIVSFWAVSKVVQLDNWKTGYGIHMFWPSSWS